MENIESRKTYANYIKNKYVKLSKQLLELTEKCQEYSIETKSSGHDDKILDVYCKNKKILSAHYEILGTYDSQCNLFFWAKNMQLIDKQSTKLSKRIKSYHKEIEEMILNKKYNDLDYLEKILYYTKNNIFFMMPDNLETLIEFSVTISECKGVLSQVNDNLAKENKIVYSYYLITDIIGT